MNEYQQNYAEEHYDAFVQSLPLGSPPISHRDVWNAAMEVMWGQPLSVGNLQAKVAELEERLQNIGSKHRTEMQALETTNAGQAALLRGRYDEIKSLRDEIESWKSRMNSYVSEVSRRDEEDLHRQLEEARQEERAATQEVCEAKYRIDLQKAIDRERDHFDALKETILAGQRIVMLDEFNRQYHALEESWSRRLDEANKRLAPGSPDLLAVNTRWDEYVHDLRGRLQTEFHEEMEKLEVKNRELRQKVERMEQSAVQQITDFTDRFLADDEYRRGVLEDAINTRIDQGVIILKGMVALELRRKPDRADSSLILPSEEDFDAWWNGIHWSAGPDLLAWDALARRAWEEALSRVRLS